MGFGSLFKKGPLGDALFGSDNKKSTSVALKDFTDFNIGGVSGTKKDGAVSISPTDARADLVGGLSGTYNNQAGGIRSFLPQVDTAFNDFIGTVNNEFLPQVKPGFGALSSAQADAFGVARERLNNSRRAAESNLSEDLNRRKISGSSFAQDTKTRTSAEFDALDRELSAAEGNAKAQAALQELDASVQLIEKSHTANVQRINTSYQITNDAFMAEAKAKGVALDDMNNILEIGANILSKTTAQAAENARFEAELAYKEAEGKAAADSQLGGLIGGGLGFMVGGPVGGAIGSGIGSSLFS